MSSHSNWAEQLAPWHDSQAPAVVGDGYGWQGRDLMAQARAAAAWLDAEGLPAHTAVPALVSTGGPAVALVVAGALSQRPMAPLGTRLMPDELVACVQRLDSPVIISSPAHATLAHTVAERTGRRVAIVPEWLPAQRELARRAAPDDIAFLLHTSGTSGLPKPVPVTQRVAAARTQTFIDLEQLGPGAVFACASPFHHIGGVGVLACALGAGAAVMPLPQFSIAAWRQLGQHGVTHAQAVPSMIDMLLAEGALNFGPSLQLLHYGGSGIHVDTLRAAMAALPGVKFVQMFGQTEGSPITALDTAGHLHALSACPEILGSVGRAVAGLELRIDQPDEVGCGEVLARAPHLSVCDAEGWLHTGDVGRLDAQGYLYLSGRKGDMIIRGGENIYPTEVEDVLRRHPAVRDAAVVGSPDRRWGEVVHAFIVPVDAATAPEPEALRAFTREALAGYKVPVGWTFVNDLPRNAAGKVLRRELKQRLAAPPPDRA